MFTSLEVLGIIFKCRIYLKNHAFKKVFCPRGHSDLYWIASKQMAWCDLINPSDVFDFSALFHMCSYHCFMFFSIRTIEERGKWAWRYIVWRSALAQNASPRRTQICPAPVGFTKQVKFPTSLRWLRSCWKRGHQDIPQGCFGWKSNSRKYMMLNWMI